MEKHIRVVGILYITLGVFFVLASLVLFLVMASGALIQDGQNSGATKMALLIAGISLLALSVPSIIGGFGLIQHRSWARPLVIFLSAINLLSFPVGTIVGIYALWALLKPDTRAMFRPRTDLWARTH
jgi:hypothetical protein